MGVKRSVWLFLGGLVLLILIAFMSFWFLSRPHRTTQNPDPKIIALHQLENATKSKLKITIQNGFPRGVLGEIPVEGDNTVERARNFLQEYKDLYLQNDPNLKLSVRRVSGEENEFVHFYQTYQGLEVFGSEFLVMVNGENVTATIGGLLPSGRVLDIHPLVDANQAVNFAKEEDNRLDVFVVGEPNLMVYDPSIFSDAQPDPTLVWRIPLGPGATKLFYVDAHSGEIILDGSLAVENYELDHEDANGYPDASDDCYWLTTADDWIGDETGLITEYLNDIEAVNSWHYIQSAYYFFRDQYGRDSYDGKGGEIELYIYSGTNNAKWIGGTGCDLIEFHQGWVAWDIMVHELSHGVQFYTSQIGMHGGTGQDFALKESLADIQAVFADGNDWLQGDNRTGLPGYVRNIESPIIDHWNKYNTAGTEVAAYENSGIPSKAAYLTAVGGKYTFEIGKGLGRRNMGHLYYGVMVALPSHAKFIDARNLAMAIAAQHFSPEDVCTVRNAWAAVGVGTADVGCDGIPDPDLTDTDEDYIIDNLDNCVDIYNPYQDDFDSDGMGDACDIDDDNDGIMDPEDNCPFLINPKQMDTDRDGKGDPCDEDDEDLDGIIDLHDNCPFASNPSQLDSDNDGLGNACDQDLDGDGVNEIGTDGKSFLDNCPFEFNPDQRDRDGDGIGDACDGCPNDADINPMHTYMDPFNLSLGMFPKPYQPDSDGDGTPDACDDNVAVDGSRVNSEKFFLDPDGLRHQFEVQGESGKFQKVPIPTCQPEDGWYPKNYYGRIILKGVDEKVGVWLGDSAGFSAGKTKRIGDQRVIDFQPRGGMNYTLLIGFHPEYPSGQLSKFDFYFECGERALLEDSIESPPTQEVPTIEPSEEFSASRCELFEGDYSLSLLDIPADTTDITLYIEIPGGVPGLAIDVHGDDDPWEYSARLGDIESDVCENRYYPERLYCDFVVPQFYLGSAQPLSIYVNGCDLPIFEHPWVSILPEPSCFEGLDESECVEAGGTYECVNTSAGAPICICTCPDVGGSN